MAHVFASCLKKHLPHIINTTQEVLIKNMLGLFRNSEMNVR